MHKANVVRELVQQELSNLGFAVAESQGEIHLLRDGHVVGRGFKFVGVHAVWITDSDTVVFYDQDGGHLKTVTISEGTQRVAA